VKRIKSYSQFFEDATSTASSTSGMGAVANATVGGLAGVPGSSGSGDMSFYLKPEKKRKKGDPSKVTDLRDLEPAKGVTVLKESYRLTDDENRKIEQCLDILYDNDFKLTALKYIDEDESVDIDDEVGDFFRQEIIIGLHKNVKTNWTGNITISKKFDKTGFEKLKISTGRSTGSELNESEKEFLEMVEDSAIKLINYLNYQSGTITISWYVAGGAMPWNEERNVNINIGISLLKIEKDR